jgi:hypothetical protein
MDTPELELRGQEQRTVKISSTTDGGQNVNAEFLTEDEARRKHEALTLYLYGHGYPEVTR